MGMVSDIRLSTVVPATVSDENNAYELTNMDLVMKLHYIHGVYFFTSEAVQGFSIQDLKKPMFPLLDLYFMASGRVRRSETGRPFIKCNDSGVRIVEAKSDKTIDEALAMEDHSFHHGLVYHQALGPDLSFSPLVYIQVPPLNSFGHLLNLLQLLELVSNFFSLLHEIKSKFSKFYFFKLSSI